MYCCHCTDSEVEATESPESNAGKPARDDKQKDTRKGQYKNTINVCFCGKEGLKELNLGTNMDNLASDGAERDMQISKLCELRVVLCNCAALLLVF